MSNVIWDSFFIQGDIIIFKAVLGILNLLKNELIMKTSMEDIKHNIS